MKEIALYIHIPFCKQKCYYCDFPSYAHREKYMDAYIEALIKELKDKAKNNIFKTIFIGGGTPSYLRIDLLERLLIEIKNIKKSDKYEFTIECNPGTLEEDKLKVMKKYGVNRLSFGLQAVQNKFLKNIGRIHTFEEFKENLQKARELGFNNINADLMFGLPNQSVEDWKESLESIASLGLEHISAYSLIIEEGTPFYEMYKKDLIKLPCEEEEREMYKITKEILCNNGYHQYEISNYSKDGYECLHNKVYWNCEEYIGVGSSASSFFNNERYSNYRDIEKYIQSIEKENLKAKEISHKNSLEDNIEEFMFMGLRLIQGVEKSEFSKRFKKDIYSIYGDVIEKNKLRGLLNENKERLFLSDKGIEVSNSVMCEFILEK